jgi:flagellar biosynthesis protein FliQ
MRADVALQLLVDLLWNALLISMPLLAVTLVVGLAVSVLQVITQVQESSLTFIPKAIASILVLVAAGPWMLKRLVAYASSLIGEIPRLF